MATRRVNCIVCNTEFEATRSDAKFCSDNCRKSPARYQADDNPYLVSGVKPVEYLTSGFPELDELTKGGIPKRMLTLIYGSFGVGKTTLGLTIARYLTLEGKRVLYFDVETALNPERLQAFQLDPELFKVSYDSEIEDIAPKMIAAIPEYDAIILDSIATMGCRAEAMQIDSEEDFGKANVGLKAKLMAALCRQVPGRLYDSNCALIWINQLRDQIGSTNPYVKETYIPGGIAQSYTAGLMLKLVKGQKFQRDNAYAGHKVKVRVEKSRISPPFREAEIKLFYEPNYEA